MNLVPLSRGGVDAYTSAGHSYMCYCVNGSRPELATKIDSCIEELIQDGDAGMDDHIAKPIDIGNLKQVLSKFI